MLSTRLGTGPHLLVKLHDELGSFGDMLRLSEDHVVWCDCWSKTALNTVYPETALLPLRGRQKMHQLLHVEILGVQRLPGRLN